MPPTTHPDSVARRRAAEERVRLRLGKEEPRTAADLVRLRHEWEAHQVELEMQNEELHADREALAAELRDYTELYDFAPVGYFTLSADGTIRRANLTGAALVGGHRTSLVGRRFEALVTETARLTFSDFVSRVFPAPTVKPVR